MCSVALIFIRQKKLWMFVHILAVSFGWFWNLPAFVIVKRRQQQQHALFFANALQFYLVANDIHVLYTHNNGPTCSGMPRINEPMYTYGTQRVYYADTYLFTHISIEWSCYWCALFCHRNTNIQCCVQSVGLLPNLQQPQQTVPLRNEIDSKWFNCI